MTTALPHALSPRDYDHLLIEARQAGLDEVRAEERRLGLDRYAVEAAKRGETVPTVETRPALPEEAIDELLERAWWSGPRHARPPEPRQSPDTWVRWTPLDLPLAGLVLLAFAYASVHEAVAQIPWRQDPWMWAASALDTALVWLALHEPSFTEHHDNEGWRAFPTAEWPGVMNQWTQDDISVRAGVHQ